MVDEDKEALILRGLRQLRKRVDGELTRADLAGMPRLMDLISSSDQYRAGSRLRSALRRYGRDDDVRAARVMLGNLKGFNQKGVEARLEALAQADFTSVDTVRRRGDRGLKKIAWVLAEPELQLNRTPIISVQVVRSGTESSVRVEASYLVEESAPPGRPRVEIHYFICPTEFPWVDGDERTDEYGLWKSKFCEFVQPEGDLPPSMTFWFADIPDFRTSIEVARLASNVVARVVQIAEGITITFRYFREDERGAANRPHG